MRQRRHGDFGGGKSAVSRREFLAAMGAAAAGSVAGCLGESTDVSVLSAGSLATVFESTVGPTFSEATEYGYRGEFHGSNAVMRMVLEEQKRPEVIVSADAGLLRERLPASLAPWDVVFASNAVVIAYGEGTETGSRLEDGDPWYEVLESTAETVAMSDPDLDPLGYRAVQLFELAETHYGVEELRETMVETLTVDSKEDHLLAGVESGNRAGAIVYENMAVDHGVPYVSLPEELDFSDPTLADHYAQATYTTEDGTTVEGRPVRYNLTVPTNAADPAAGEAFAAFLLDNPDLLAENGLLVGEAFPRPNGDVPEGVLP